MKEQQNIEWKESWRDEYLRWICGFANAQGGTLIIGKNDSGKIVGLLTRGAVDRAIRRRWRRGGATHIPDAVRVCGDAGRHCADGHHYEEHHHPD